MYTNQDSFTRALERDVLARTMWGEARGEGSVGMQAVAFVILNRASIARARDGRHWWGATVVDICQKPFQFSCWNRNDPNRLKVLRVEPSDTNFALAMRLADQVLSGRLNDPTHGATHYHAAGMTPHWAQDQKPVAVIGRHIFYRFEE